MTQSPNKKLAHKLRPKIDRPIVFVGLMGCGKSSLGKALAPLLGLDFFDADNEIEDAAGMSVSGPGGFGTVSSSLLALPRRPQTLTEPPRRPLWLFSAGAPDRGDYAPVDLS